MNARKVTNSSYRVNSKRTNRTKYDHNKIQYKLSSLQISPEAEALLRAIFRNLDPYDTGMVPLPLLLSSILNDYDGGDGREVGDIKKKSNIDNDNNDRNEINATEIGTEITNINNVNVDDHLDGDNSINYMTKFKKIKNMIEFSGCLSSLGILISRALGIDRLYILIKSLLKLLSSKSSSTLSSYDLTWGEFLLQLIPSLLSTLASPNYHKDKIIGSSRTSNSVDDSLLEDDDDDDELSTLNHCALTVDELKDLRLLGLIGDLDWGIIPLALPDNLNIILNSSSSSSSLAAVATSSAKKTNVNNTKAIASTTTTTTSMYSERENRLLKERNYCLFKLQQMSRLIERRAENIKSYFDNQIRKSIIKQQHMHHHIDELKNKNIIYENRLKELSILHDETKKHYHNQITSLEEKNQILHQNMTCNQKEIIDKYKY